MKLVKLRFGTIQTTNNLRLIKFKAVSDNQMLFSYTRVRLGELDERQGSI